ncbi:MAG: hypothetical protein IPJ68_00715 [Candidatus Moraniibacteriota bacterium]|nr:MAG: hypothetical protein IPJ68_00715 [Candidatus Moranbacteria bacterium]
MQKFFVVAFIVIGVGFLISFLQKDRWSLFVYPNGELAEEAIKAIDSYESFEECLAGFEFSKRSLPNATFECGYKCKIQDKELGLYICKETRD